ncbi:hypothetical protein AN662_0220075 [Klebsiella pneumoniae subsp. pneumoniae]|nr:hypothetical protein AN662_0220075 [Klebsiella pneumoniae subsp. pneumoniae]
MWYTNTHSFPFHRFLMMVYFSAQQRQDGKIFVAIFRCLQNETVTNFL